MKKLNKVKLIAITSAITIAVGGTAAALSFAQSHDSAKTTAKHVASADTKVSASDIKASETANTQVSTHKEPSSSHESVSSAPVHVHSWTAHYTTETWCSDSRACEICNECGTHYYGDACCPNCGYEGFTTSVEPIYSTEKVIDYYYCSECGARK